MNIPVLNCSSCAACANVCSRGVISMQLDFEGFYRPVIDAEKCIQCGACERACPWIKDVQNPNGSNDSPKTMAAYAKDDEIRLASSSGGIFSVLAEKILDDGGVVVGVSQLSPTRFGHIVIDNKADLEKLRGSKYVQANAGLIYKEVRNLLKEGRKVLFSGTPCQVAALYSVLGKTQYENLYTVDIVCHGTPSVKVWEKFVGETEQSTKGSVKQSFFRDKRLGWRLFSMTNVIEYNTGDCFQSSIPMNRDKFMRAFLQNICLNSSCASCHYGKLPRVADITLGDYWNIARVHPQMDDNKGTSVVLLNTTHGADLFNSVADQVKYCESSVENAIAGNPCIVRSSIQHPRRAEFFAALDQFPLSVLIKKFCPYPSLPKRALFKIRRILGAVKRKILS